MTKISNEIIINKFIHTDSVNWTYNNCKPPNRAGEGSKQRNIYNTSNITAEFEKDYSETLL